MTDRTPDKLHYLHIPDGHGGRAEMVRLVYVLANAPFVDVFTAIADFGTAVEGKNPFKQFPFVETPSGELIYQTLAIMHHAAHGTSAWPAEPAALTRALSVALGAYDLYQAFGGFSADDAAAKKKFEERRMPQYFAGLDEIYAGRKFAAGDTPTFADAIATEAVAWCVRRNPASAAHLETKPALVEFQKRFDALPAIADFRKRQAAARATNSSV
ncbi:MAG: glutathione S-transferase family protein [Myxococcales bacterium]|nr:glutathione S-transferase family protein [Myxococcales bacterium]